jgi:hypothetical protein
MHMYLCVHVHTYIHRFEVVLLRGITYIHTRMIAYIYTYTHACIYTHMHAHIHTCR